MSSRTDRHVVVVKGGHSVERQVSLVSGRECAAALRRVGYKVTEVDAGNNRNVDLENLDAVDLARTCSNPSNKSPTDTILSFQGVSILNPALAVNL